jgi:hypothetical protein
MLKRTMTRAHLQVHRIEWVSQSPYFARYQTQVCFVGVCAKEEGSIGDSKTVIAHTHRGVGKLGSARSNNTISSRISKIIRSTLPGFAGASFAADAKKYQGFPQTLLDGNQVQFLRLLITRSLTPLPRSMIKSTTSTSLSP